MNVQVLHLSFTGSGVCAGFCDALMHLRLGTSYLKPPQAWYLYCFPVAAVMVMQLWKRVEKDGEKEEGKEKVREGR